MAETRKKAELPALHARKYPTYFHEFPISKSAPFSYEEKGTLGVAKVILHFNGGAAAHAPLSSKSINPAVAREIRSRRAQRIRNA
jgi:hypothetical protein